MRQKYVIWAALLVVVTVIAAIAVFAIVRQGGHVDNHDGNAGHHEDSSDKQLSGTLKDSQRVIKMKARQFEFEPNRIVVKKGEKVRLEVITEDVTHGIKIEAFDINTELKPDKIETITFIANKSGQFHFHCSVYCGKGHADMHGKLIVLE
jgi:cytochrome c oxidase subunit 2